MIESKIRLMSDAPHCEPIWAISVRTDYQDFEFMVRGSEEMAEQELDRFMFRLAQEQAAETD